jgi:hypothetical protein
MPQPSSANDLLSDLQSFALLDRLADGRVGGGSTHAGRPLPDEQPTGEEYPRPARRDRVRRPAGRRHAGRTGRPDLGTAGGEAQRPA